MTTNNAVNTGLSGATGTGSFVGSNSPVLVTPTLGAALATSINFGDTSISKYKQGTFTPTITGSSANPTTITYGYQFGEYTIIGNVVYFSLGLSVATLTIGAAAGDLQLTGLPVASANTAGLVMVGSATCAGMNLTSYDWVQSYIPLNSSVVKLVEAQGNAAVNNNQLIPITSITNSSVIQISGFYFTS